jgi:hypothetical protein
MARIAKVLLLTVLVLACLVVSSHAQSAGGRIQGTITDSLRGGPLVGATVVAIPDKTLRDTVFHSTQTDQRGHFVLANLRPGPYSVSVEHPVIDSTGIGVPFAAITVSDAQPAETSLAIPSVASLRRALCPIAVQDTSLGVMLGTVRRADGQPVPNATLVIFWTDFDVDKSRVSVRTRQIDAIVQSDASGDYRACGLPVQRSLFVQAQGESDSQSGVLEELIGMSGVLLRDFHIGRGGALTALTAVDSSSNAPTYAVTGKVTTLAGTPIVSAQVSLLATSRSSTTNDQGEFRISGVSPGTQGLHVIALGYYPQVLRVEIGGGDAPVVVKMENAAVVLDSMRVIAKRSGPRLRLAHREFENRKSGVGTFLDEKQIAALHPMGVADIFRHLPGVRVVTPRGAVSEIVVSSRGTATIMGAPTVCPLDVFLDGMRISGGSTPEKTRIPFAGASEINLLAPESLYGIEVHTVATAPVRYKIGNCGAVFLWTK